MIADTVYKTRWVRCMLLVLQVSHWSELRRPQPKPWGLGAGRGWQSKAALKSSALTDMTAPLEISQARDRRAVSPASSCQRDGELSLWGR